MLQPRQSLTSFSFQLFAAERKVVFIAVLYFIRAVTFLVSNYVVSLWELHTASISKIFLCEWECFTTA